LPACLDISSSTSGKLGPRVNPGRLRPAKPAPRPVDPVALSARLLAAKGSGPTWRVAGPGPVRLVGFDPCLRRLVAAVTSPGQLLRALVELLGDAGLAGAVRQGAGHRGSAPLAAGAPGLDRGGPYADGRGLRATRAVATPARACAPMVVRPISCPRFDTSTIVTYL
jgi:hypothetical protein